MDLESAKKQIKELLRKESLKSDEERFGVYTGQGKFRDTGRQSSGYGEAMDSIVGAPARQAISEVQNGLINSNPLDPYGKIDLAALRRVIERVGADPEKAPTGYDIASKATDNPYLGTALATAIDVGAQIPIPGMQLGARGIIKELEGPLFHGSPKKFPAGEIKPSRGGYVGPGVYLGDTKGVAKGYGENVHAYKPSKVNIVDLYDNNDDLLHVAKELGIEDGVNKRLAVKGIGGVNDSPGRFYALQDSLIEKIDPDFKLIGNERAEAINSALKEKGYTGIKFRHNGKAAYNNFDPQNLSPVQDSKGLLDSIKTPEQAVALKGAERENYLKALDEVHGPRDQRAKDMGFGKKIYYHGTGRDFDKFDPAHYGKNTMGPMSKDAAFFTSSPELASDYAGEVAPRVMPVKVNQRGGAAIYPEMSTFGDDDANNVRGLFNKGHDTALVKGVHDPYLDTSIGESDLLAVKNPAKIRSTNAAFDPRFKDSSLLLAGKTGPGQLPINVSPTQKDNSMDLDKMTDDELRQLAVKKSKGQSDPLDSMSDDELRKMANKKAYDEFDKQHNSGTGSPFSYPSSIKDIKLPGGTVGGYAKGAVDAIPAVGAIGGGMIGGLPGAALGGVGGAAVQNLANQYLLNEKTPTREEYYGGLVEGAKTGLMQEMTGGIINKAGESFANSGVQNIGKSFNRPGAPEIAAAASNLKVKPTQGMMTDDYMIRNTENSLSQSPYIAGSLVRAEQQPIQDVIKSTSEKALENASQRSNFDTGREMRSGIANKFQAELEPLEKSYDEIQSHTKNIDLDPKALKRVANNIRNIEQARFKGFDGHRVANQFADALEGAKNVNDIKILRTEALGIVRDPTASSAAKQAAGEVIGRLERSQQNSITRQAVQVAREAPVDRTSGGEFLNKAQKAVADSEAVAEGQNIGKKLIGDIKTTNKGYRELMKSIKEFGEGTGITKGRSAGSAIEDIKAANPQDMAKALFDESNIEFTNKVKSKFPEQYELAKQEKLAEIASKSQAPNGEVDPKKLLKISQKLPEEVQVMLFGEGGVKNLADVDTLVKSIPAKIGSSDTPRGIQFQHLLSVPGQVADMGRYGFMKAKPKFEKVGNSVQGWSRPAGAGLVQGGGMIKRGLVGDR